MVILALAAAAANPLPVGLFFNGLRQGSAFLISDCEVATAKHIFARNVSIGAKGRFMIDGHNVRARVTHVGNAANPRARGESRAGDWVVARLDECVGRGLGHFRLLGRPLLQSRFARRANQLVGYPVLSAARVRAEACQPWAELADGSVQLACTARTGQSGGPVYVRDEVGDLVAIGVVSASDPETGFTFAVGTSEIAAALQKQSTPITPIRTVMSKMEETPSAFRYLNTCLVASPLSGLVEGPHLGFNFLLIPLSAIDPEPAHCLDPPALDERLRKARAIQKFRLQRDTNLPADLLGEPGWDMLLTAYIADSEGHKSPVSSICAGAAVPPTTALRWLTLLEKRGLLQRFPDPNDKRRAYIRLSESARAIMDEVLDRAP